MKKKVLLIDPWGTSNTSEYLNGLIYGLGSVTDLTVFTNSYFNLKVDTNVDIHRVFFKKTEVMARTTLRRVLRGLEYIDGYRQIFKYLKRHDQYDVIHIDWLLMYSLDVKYIKKLKQYTKKIVYTAHNVLPHINGKEYISRLDKIYAECDKIILHGESIKKEFETYFPKYVDKIYIQKHGCNLSPSIGYDESKVPEDIKVKISKYEKLYIFFGYVFFNKGTDRLVNLWDPSWNDSLLIIAGRRDGEYPQLDALKDKIKKSDNILELNGFVDDNLLNYLIDRSVIILLPYRHASMSGVVFTATDFKKTILCTNVGALPEYLENGVDSFIVENNEQALKKKIDEIRFLKKEDLQEMGNRLANNISNKCSWKKIASRLVDECY